MAGIDDEIDFPAWARVVCGLTAVGLVSYIVRGWWRGSMPYTVGKGGYSYSGSLANQASWDGPLELTLATLFLGGVAAFFGVLAGKPALIRKPWVIVPLVVVMVGAQGVAHCLSP